MKGVGNHKTRAVGFNISTKSIGSYRREVLDNDYKWPEGSEEEREAWQTAFNFSSVPDYFSSHLARFPIKIFESKDGESKNTLHRCISVIFPDDRRAARGCSKKSPDQKSLDWSGVKLIESRRLPDWSGTRILPSVKPSDNLANKWSRSFFN